MSSSARARRALKVLFAIVVIDGTIAGLVGPIQPEFVEGTSTPARWITASSLIFVTLGFLAAPILGAISDVYGRRPVLIGAGIATVIGAVVLLRVRLPFLLVNRLFDGASMGAYGTLRSAVVDASTEEHLARNTGLVNTISSIGFIVGPAVASVVLFGASVTGIASAPAVVVTSIGLGVLSLGLCFVLPETRGIHAPIDGARASAAVPAIDWREVCSRSFMPTRLVRRARILADGNPGVWQLLVAELALNIGLGYYFYFITLIAEGPLHLSPQGIANLSAFWAVILVVAQLVFFNRYVMRIDRVRWVRVLLLVGVGVMLGYAFVGDRLGLFLLVAALDCLTISFVPGMIEGLMAEAVPEASRGELFGIRQSVASTGWVLALVVATVLSEVWIGAPFLVFGAAFVACFWTLRHFHPGKSVGPRRVDPVP